MKTRRFPAALAAAFLVPALAGCGDSGSPVRPVPQSAPTFVQSWGFYGSDEGEFNQPLGIASDSDGFIYVTDTQHHRIQKFTQDGDFVSSWGSFGGGPGQFIHPTAIAITSDGTAYVGDLGYRVQAFTLDGEYRQWLDFYCVEAGLALDADGNLLIAGSRILQRIPYLIFEGPYLWTLDRRGNILKKWDVPHTHDFDEWTPRGVTVDRNGNIYVTGSDSHRIGFQDKVKDGEYVWKLDRTGKLILRWGLEGDAAEGRAFEGIALDSQGSMYVADWLGKRMVKFNHLGETLAEWSDAGEFGLPMRGPVGVLVDDSDRIYVVDWGYHRVMKFGYN